MSDTPMTHADWLRAIAAWCPDHKDHLLDAADHIEELDSAIAARPEAQAAPKLTEEQISVLRATLRDVFADPRTGSMPEFDALCDMALASLRAGISGDAAAEGVMVPRIKALEDALQLCAGATTAKRMELAAWNALGVLGGRPALIDADYKLTKPPAVTEPGHE